MSNLSVNTITNAAGGNTAQINGMTPTAQSLQGFRNRIINGDMRIDQRNAGASVTPVSGTFLVDRWQTQISQSSRLQFQQNRGSVTPPAGFTNYLGAATASVASVGAADFFTLIQTVEGFNVADLGWGTANAQAVTLSFRVYSSLTGTFGGSIYNNAFNRSYPFTYSVSSANTWTTVTINIAGDTSGTWVTNNGLGLGLCFSLGAGSTYSGTAGAWAGAGLFSATGAVSVVGTSGATFYITGVQLEAGSVATPFERRPFGTELALCQRYYEKTFPVDVAPVNAAGQSSAEVFLSAPASGGDFGNMYFSYPWKVTKRASPTVTAFNTRDTVAGTWSTYASTVRANTAPTFETVTTSVVNGYLGRGSLAIAAMTASAEL